MIQDAEKYADVDRERKERVEKRSRAEGLLHQAERQLREVALDLGMQFARNRRYRIDNISRELRESLQQDDDRGIDQAYADLQDALSELSREVREFYLDEEDDDLFGTIREIFTGDNKERDRERDRDWDRDSLREPYRERDYYNKDRDYDSRNYRNDNRSYPNDSGYPRRKSRPSYQDNWDDEDDDWL